MATVTVAFVDDHPVLLDGMAALFSSKGGFEVLARGTNAQAAMDIAAQHGPDILFLDLSMPGKVFEAIGSIAVSSKNTRIIIFTAFSSVESALRALDAGAMGFVLKGSMAQELFEAVDAVMRGEVYITQSYASQLMAGLRNKAKRDNLSQATRLSVREQQIVGHLLNARTNREIACILNISEKTVKHYMTTLMHKLNARNRVEVVIAAQQQNALDRQESAVWQAAGEAIPL